MVCLTDTALYQCLLHGLKNKKEKKKRSRGRRPQGIAEQAVGRF